jgi:hypothetical protein
MNSIPSPSILGTDFRNGRGVAISQKARQQGLYIIGANGTGKSTLLANLILTDIRGGLGACLIEPHGDLTNTVLAGIPDSRLKDVILLDMTDSEYPFGLNLFQCGEPRTIREMALTANFVQHVFEKIWGVGTDTPRLMQVLRAVTRTLIENPGTTFAEIPLLFSSDTVREKMVANLTNTEIISFWEDYNRKSPYHRDEYVESTKNKIKSFLDEPMIKNIVAQSKTTIYFRKIMDEGKILLVKLSPQFEESSMLIGAIIIGQLLLAAWSRGDIPEEKRRQFNLYCDEYQRFATSDFATLISEARKFRIATTLSHQTLSQLDEANRAAAAAAANMIVFRVSGEDGKTLAKNFDTTPTKEAIGQEPIRAPVSDVIGHLVKRGHSDPRATRFAQVYLQNFESFLNNLTGYDRDYQFHSAYLSDLRIRDSYIHKGREELNQSLYRCMRDGNSRFLIPPLALYILAAAQRDRSEDVFTPYINHSGWILSPFYFQGFKEEAAVFGNPSFIDKNYAARFIYYRREEPTKNAAVAVVKMITELRYTMDVLAQDPILVDTGQYQTKYQNRTYADMENQIARDLTRLPNFQAKVKLLSGEHVIHTKDLPHVLSGKQLDTRINQIKIQMAFPTLGICRYYKDVGKEIRERQERLKSISVSNEPPPTRY